MDPHALFDAEMEEHRQVFEATRAALAEPFARLCAACLAAVRGGHKVVLFGNGGSAADAQHLATELVCRFEAERAAIPALALTTDTSALTAIGNDYGFEHLFARQVEGLCRPGDVVVGISTSGNSANVIRALETARAMGCVVAGLGGHDGGKMVGLADPFLIVPARDTARIQEMHITLGHMLCAWLEEELARR